MYLLQDVIRKAVSEQSQQVAISQSDGLRYTYAELEKLSNQFASMLLENLPKDGFFVGITSAVSARSVLSLFGILKAGSAYVPLDIQSPQERLHQIVSDASLEVIVLDPLAYLDYESLLSSKTIKRVILLEELPHEIKEKYPNIDFISWSVLADYPDSVPTAPVRLFDDLAYILYTSGSTGIPKGVMLTHRNARTFVDWMVKEFELTPDDRILSRSPFNFDLSVFDVFSTFSVGATLLIQERRRQFTSTMTSKERHTSYVNFLREQQATILYTTPSTFLTLIDKGGLDEHVSLRTVMYAGEPFPPALLKKLMTVLPQTKVANIYGPTETNIVTYFWVEEVTDDMDSIPIGRAVDDTEIEIVDVDGKRCNLGEKGEIWVRGGTVCQGYFGRPDMTKASLVDSPFHPYPSKYWRTGDYGYLREDGEIIYCGRLDNMVKTRGNRVELGDVESAFSLSSVIAQATVVPFPHEKYGNTLHAFVVLEPGKEETPQQLMEFIEQKLPTYMLPKDITILPEFPTTSTGKVDRQSLIASMHEGE